MKNKTFLICLVILLAICVSITAAHLIYAYQAYENSSIIQFVAGEIW